MEEDPQCVRRRLRFGLCSFHRGLLLTWVPKSIMCSDIRILAKVESVRMESVSVGTSGNNFYSQIQIYLRKCEKILLL